MIGVAPIYTSNHHVYHIYQDLCIHVSFSDLRRVKYFPM